MIRRHSRETPLATKDVNPAKPAPVANPVSLKRVRLVLRPYYLARPRLWREPLVAMDARSVVSHRWRYVYLRVPKAANSTVLRTLLERLPEPGLDPADIDRAKVRTVHFRNLRAGELRETERYFTFAVVRDPYVRLLSAYLDKFREGHKYLPRYGARVAARDGGRISFLGFCRYLADGGEEENAHWMRQTRLTGLVERLDFIGRVESLEADLAAITGRIDGTASAGIAAGLANAGPAPTGAARRLAEHYDAECRQIVAEIYAEDFARFGYLPEPPDEAGTGA